MAAERTAPAPCGGAWARFALAALAIGSLHGGVHAEEEDRARASLSPPLPVAARAPTPDEQVREQLLRGGGVFGPQAVREADAALLAAMRKGQWAEALRLLKSGAADANARDPAGGHPLVLAARAGQDDVLRELLRRGTDTRRVGDGGFTALGAAAFAGHRSSVRLLLRAGAEPDRFGATGQSALHLAGIAGRVTVIDELLKSGANIETLNRQRETVLDVAAAAGQQEVMDYLIKAGANLELAGRR